MKIVVHNYKYQFALSRSQVEAILSVLPKEYSTPIHEFHLTSVSPYKGEVFEFFPGQKVAYFAYPVQEKNREDIASAITELLIGLARIKACSQFGVRMSERERSQYRSFIDEWRDKCLRAAGAANEP